MFRCSIFLGGTIFVTGFVSGVPYFSVCTIFYERETSTLALQHNYICVYGRPLPIPESVRRRVNAMMKCRAHAP